MSNAKLPSNVESAENAPRCAKFGPFKLDLATGELRKHGVRVRLQGRPFQILKALLEKPGEIVTREDLRVRLWSTDMYVDFESGMNTAVNRLRAALSDSADNPIYVETLSRLGYRFVAPVQFEPVNEVVEPVPVPVSEPEPVPFLPQPPAVKRRWSWFLAAGLAGVLVIIGTLWLLALKRGSTQDQFEQLSFGTGEITEARFSADGKSIAYSAFLNGAPPRLFLIDTKTHEINDLGLNSAVLLGYSPKGELAVRVMSKEGAEPGLEIVDRKGRPLRKLPEGTIAVDWARDGQECLVVLRDGHYEVQYPEGTTIYSGPEWIDNVRVSPNGQYVAMLRHPFDEDDAGEVVLLQPGRTLRVLTGNWGSIRGLAWSRFGNEIWFTAAHSGINRQIRAVDLHGEERTVAEVPGSITVHDIANNGLLLVTRDAAQMSMFMAELPSKERHDISWLDWPVPHAIAGGGKRVLFDESGDAGGNFYQSFTYDATAARPYKAIGPGRAIDLSADGQWALTQLARQPNDLRLVSTVTGKASEIAAHGFRYSWAKFVGGAKPGQLLVGGSYQDSQPGVFRQKLPAGTPVRLTRENVSQIVVNDSGTIAAGNALDSIAVLDLRSGTVRTIPNPRHLRVAGFAADEQLVVWHSEPGYLVFDEFDLDSGKTRSYGRLPSEPHIAADGVVLRAGPEDCTVAYASVKSISTLFTARGWSESGTISRILWLRAKLMKLQDILGMITIR